VAASRRSTSLRSTRVRRSESARQTRADIRRMLFGTPREPERVPLAKDRREPGAAGTRTLGSSTTALTKD
ncbi:hypothetical protein ABT086_44760, partial [Streptomyces mirabilis]